MNINIVLSSVNNNVVCEELTKSFLVFTVTFELFSLMSRRQLPRKIKSLDNGTPLGSCTLCTILNVKRHSQLLFLLDF